VTIVVLAIVYLLAGVWARSTYDRGILESGDLQEGLTAASAVGDGRI
jgi:predicted metalloprotease